MTRRRAAGRFARWGPVLAHMALIFTLSSISNLPAPPGGVSDKQAHGFFYGLLAVLVVRALNGGAWTGAGASTSLAAWAVATAYGATDEWHQRFVPGRTADLADLAADATGAAVGLVLLAACGIIARFSRQRASSSSAR